MATNKQARRVGVDLTVYKFMDCRVFRHQWTRVLTNEQAKPGCYILAADCIRCGAEKTVHFEKKTGRFVSRKMSYPHDYLISENPYKPRDFRIAYAKSLTL